jgi:trypsin
MRFFWIILSVSVSSALSALLIMGGNKIRISDAPYHAGLLFKDWNTEQQRIIFIYQCGGSFLSKRWVVSAAHCFELEPRPKPSDVIVSGNSNTHSDGTAIELQVLDCLVHPLYKEKIDDYDVALLHIMNRPDFPTAINFVRLPYPNQEFTDGTILRVTGWGQINSNEKASKELLFVDVPIYNHEKCALLYRAYGRITGSMICAGFKNGGFDACSGMIFEVLIPFNLSNSIIR